MMEYYVIIIKDTGKTLIQGKYTTLKEAKDNARKLWRSLPPYNAERWEVEVRGYKAGSDSEYTTYDWYDS